MVFITKNFLEVAIENWSELNLNPQPLYLYTHYFIYMYIYTLLYISIFTVKEPMILLSSIVI